MNAAGDVRAVISSGNVSTAPLRAPLRAAVVKDTPGLARGALAPSEKQAKLVNGAKPEVLPAGTGEGRHLSCREDFNPYIGQGDPAARRFCYEHFSANVSVPPGRRAGASCKPSLRAAV